MPFSDGIRCILIPISPSSSITECTHGLIIPKSSPQTSISDESFRTGRVLNACSRQRFSCNFHGEWTGRLLNQLSNPICIHSTPNKTKEACSTVNCSVNSLRVEINFVHSVLYHHCKGAFIKKHSNKSPGGLHKVFSYRHTYLPTKVIFVVQAFQLITPVWVVKFPEATSLHQVKPLQDSTTTSSSSGGKCA